MSKTKYLGLFAILLLSAFLGASMLTSGHNWAYSDFASYIMQAQSIVDGTTSEFIEHNSVTIYQSDVEVGPVAYPWGYPLLLVPVLATVGLSTLGIKLLNVIFYIAFLIILFALFYRRLSFWGNLAILSLFAVSPIFLAFQNHILSDIAFLLFSTLSLLAIDRLSSFFTKNDKRIFIGVAIFGAFLIRTNGLLLLLTLVVYDSVQLYLNREKLKLAKEWLLRFSAPYLAFIGLWTILSLLLPDGQSSHFSHYGYQTFAGVIENMQYYFDLGIEFFAPLPYAETIYYLFVIFFFVGLFAKLRDNLLFAIYIFLTYALYISWPDRQGVRFLFPILPLFIYFAWLGIGQLTLRAPKQLQKTSFRLLWLLIFIPFVFTTGQSAIGNLSNPGENQGPFREISLDMFNYIEKRTPKDSIIVFYKPRVMRLMTDRDAILILDCAHLERGDYFAFSKEARDSGQLSQNETNECDVSLQKVFANRKFIIYQISGDVSPESARD